MHRSQAHRSAPRAGTRHSLRPSRPPPCSKRRHRILPAEALKAFGQGYRGFGCLGSRAKRSVLSRSLPAAESDRDHHHRLAHHRARVRAATHGQAEPSAKVSTGTVKVSRYSRTSCLFSHDVNKAFFTPQMRSVGARVSACGAGRQSARHTRARPSTSQGDTINVTRDDALV